MQTEEHLSSLWRENVSESRDIDLGHALRAIARAVGYVSANGEHITLADVPTGLNIDASQILISLDVLTRANHYPVPPRALDIALGTGLHEAAHSVTDTFPGVLLDKIKYYASEYLLQQAAQRIKGLTAHTLPDSSVRDTRRYYSEYAAYRGPDGFRVEEYVVLMGEVIADSYLRHDVVRSEYLARTRKYFEGPVKEDTVTQWDFGKVAIDRIVYGNQYLQPAPAHVNLLKILARIAESISKRVPSVIRSDSLLEVYKILGVGWLTFVDACRQELDSNLPMVQQPQQQIPNLQSSQSQSSAGSSSDSSVDSEPGESGESESGENSDSESLEGTEDSQNKAENKSQYVDSASDSASDGEDDEDDEDDDFGFDFDAELPMGGEYQDLPPDAGIESVDSGLRANTDTDSFLDPMHAALPKHKVEDLMKVFDEVKQALEQEKEDLTNILQDLPSSGRRGRRSRSSLTLQKAKTDDARQIAPDEKIMKQLDWLNRVYNGRKFDWKKRREMGAVDRRRLPNYEMGRTYRKQRRKQDNRRLDLILLLDLSSSMNSGAGHHVYRIASSLYRLLPKTLLYGYSAISGDTTLFNLVHAGELEQPKPSGGTPSAIALYGIANRHPESLIIHLTDGQPNYDQNVLEVMKLIEQKYRDCFIANVLLGNYKKPDYGSYTNPPKNAVVTSITNASEFPAFLLETLKPWMGTLK